MSSIPSDSFKGRAFPDLVGQASAVLAREASRVVEPLLGTLSAGPAASAVPGLDIAPQVLMGSREPLGAIGRSSSPAAAAPPQFDVNRLRQQAHELIETLLLTFRDSTGDQAVPAEDQVPLLSCIAPAHAGSAALATLRVANEEASPSELALYCTNFVADSGYEIPALRVTFAPRVVTVPSRAEASFEIKIDVPQQTPAGLYSGLIQATGTKYVKAVLTVQVL